MDDGKSYAAMMTPVFHDPVCQAGGDDALAMTSSCFGREAYLHELMLKDTTVTCNVDAPAHAGGELDVRAKIASDGADNLNSCAAMSTDRAESSDEEIAEGTQMEKYDYDYVVDDVELDEYARMLLCNVVCTRQKSLDIPVVVDSVYVVVHVQCRGDHAEKPNQPDVEPQDAAEYVV